MKPDLKKIEQLYDDNIDKYGIDSRSVGWNTYECQNLRFQKLCQVFVGADNPFSVNELGCGYGELYQNLISEGYKVTNYTGYDISDKMLSKAKEYVKAEGVKWVKSSIINTISDYSIASGIFNVRFEESNTNWEKHIYSTLANMNEHSTKGFAFNLLSSYVDFKRPHLYNADPLKYFDYCKSNFSKYVTLLHDYPLYEWTILVKKV